MVKTSSSNAGGDGLIPGRGAKIPHASRPKNQNIKQEQYCNKFNKDFKNGLHPKKNLKKKNLIPISKSSARLFILKYFSRLYFATKLIYSSVLRRTS